MPIMDIKEFDTWRSPDAPPTFMYFITIKMVHLDRMLWEELQHMVSIPVPLGTYL